MNGAQVLVLPVVWAVGEYADGWDEGREDGVAVEAVAEVLQTVFAAAVDLPPLEDDDAGEWSGAGEIVFYRRYTEGLLRRYLRLSMAAGRVPSLIGRPMFRGGRVTRYRVQGFDDVVIFVYDVERCLLRLTPLQQALLERIALQEHTQAKVAEMLGMSLRSVNRRYVESVDALSKVFLAAGLLEPMTCQAVPA